MEDQTHEEMRSLVAAYVLGAVPDGEEPRVRAHLMSCEECMAEADSYASVTSDLALAVEPAPLPDGFEDRVLAQIRAEAYEEAPAATRRRSFNLGWAFGLACLVIAAAFGAAWYDTRRDLQNEQRVASVLLRSEDEGMRLHGEGIAAMIPTRDGAVFVAEGLADPPDGHTYQLWLLDADEVESAATFAVEEGRVVIELDRSVEGFTGAAVTVEPDGGSARPTTDPVVRTT